MRAGVSHINRDTAKQLASALRLVSRQNNKVSSNNNKQEKARKQRFRVRVKNNGNQKNKSDISRSKRNDKK